jgi:hypothetical protein
VFKKASGSTVQNTGWQGATEPNLNELASALATNVQGGPGMPGA